MLADILKKKQDQPQVVEFTNELRDALLANWSRGEPEGDPPKSGMNFRASGIASMCPREYALAIVNNKSAGEIFKAETLWLFGVGTAYHEMMQNDALKSLRDVFQGWWTYSSYDDVNVDTDTDEEGRVVDIRSAEHITVMGRNRTGPVSHDWIACPKEKEDWKYVELDGYIQEFRITGHWDGILEWPEYSEVLELKTISEWGFNSVDPEEGGKPNPAHVLQVHVYMWMTGLDRARIVYIGKTKPGLKTALAEHIVRRDESIIEEIKKLLTTMMTTVDNVCSAFLTYKKAPETIDKEALQMLKDIVLKMIPNRCMECTKKSDKRPKKCSMKKECFAKSLLD